MFTAYVLLGEHDFRSKRTRAIMRCIDFIRTISEGYSPYPVFRIFDRGDSTCTLGILAVVRLLL